jgi:D-alanyl-D-alanine carboxypeptidase
MDYLELIDVPPNGTYNLGLTSPKNAYLLELFGHATANGIYLQTGKCTPANNPAFHARLITQDVGPFSVTGIAPAMRSLEEILQRVQLEVPSLYAILGTAGMQCARYTKIKQPDGIVKVGPAISNHSWGTAIDITLSGALDEQGDNRVYRGLLVLSAYFNAAGWVWGAAFPVEDAMHFEVSKSLLSRWKSKGEI